jgi:hypothetical protein
MTCVTGYCVGGPTALRFDVVLEVFTYVDQAVEPLVVSRRNAEGQFVSPSLADMDPPIEATHV